MFEFNTVQIYIIMKSYFEFLMKGRSVSLAETRKNQNDDLFDEYPPLYVYFYSLWSGLWSKLLNQSYKVFCTLPPFILPSLHGVMMELRDQPARPSSTACQQTLLSIKLSPANHISSAICFSLIGRQLKRGQVCVLIAIEVAIILRDKCNKTKL